MNATDRAAAQGSWGQILLIYVIGVLGATCISQAVPVIGDIGRLFHASREQGGWVISAPSALVAIGALLTGWLVDRFGDRALLLLGSAVVIVGDVGVTLAGTLQSLLAARVVEGVGYVCIAVASVTMMTRITHGPRRNSALTLWSSFVPMSFAVPLVLAAQLAGTDHWRWAFSGHALALAVFTVLALAVLPVADRATAPSRTQGLAQVLRSPQPWLLGVAFASAAFLQTGVVSTLPHMLSGRFGVSLGAASSIGTLGMVVNTLGCLAVGPMLNRSIAPLRVATLGILLALVGGVALYYPGPAFALAVAASSVFFLGSGIVVGLWALMPRTAPAPTSIGATSGLVTQITLWGVLFGPPAAFAAQASGQWTRPATNVVVACILCLALLWVLARRLGDAGSPGAATRPAEAAR
ncbi:MAG: MFS transporter [Gammaproteobacteria bacterium]|nr:MFS transporter [Gammaproteobacteria bacterium]